MSPAEIRACFDEAGFRLRGGACEVATYGDRKQRIEIDDAVDGLIRASTTVARGAIARDASFSHRECWERNRLSELVGLRVGCRGEVVAETWIPLAGLDADTLRLYVRHLAVTSDRFEHQLSGHDEH